MAFDIDTLSPADNDLISAFPNNQRSIHTNIKSIIVTEHHEGTGHHALTRGTDPPSDSPTAVAGTPHFDIADNTIYVHNGGVAGDITDWDAYVCNSAFTEAKGFVPGDIKIVAHNTEPSGWLKCTGQSVLVADYADLFAVISYDYGGSGLSFLVPNIKGKTIFGYQSGDALFDTMGKIGGAQTHTHGAIVSAGPSATSYVEENAPSRYVGSQTHTHTTTIPAMSHMPEYITLQYLIKT